MGKALLALVLLMAGSASASAECTCLYQGKRFKQGEIACIRIDGLTKLARCDMVLNNSSWMFLGDGCPSASIAVSAPKRASAPDHADVR